MNLYEHTIIARQDTSPSEIKQLTEKYSSIIEKNDGEIVKTENWGLLNLSYLIKKNKKGSYIHFKFKGKGNVIDVNTVGLNENISSEFSVQSYPNPTNGISNILVDLEEVGTIGITVVNILGETVYNFQSEKFSAGNYTTTVDLSNQPNGIYLAYVVVNGNQKSVRINLTKYNLQSVINGEIQEFVDELQLAENAEKLKEGTANE